ncbi:mitochondrial cardiolipin hydrolase, partial [Parus major]|uniref:mitochondrial cardiolipin hydrolase n=1 Tax=Parus major TaxID=9157 RepID=UPI0007715C5C
PGAPARPCPCPLPSGDTALSRLVRRLLSARRSLDLCVFAFSCPQLARTVQVLHHRGVRVRLVTDAQYMGMHGSQIGRLRHAGIQVRHDQHSGYMHHKFAIVDRRMLITGSLNWTTQAIQSNRENVLVVEDAEYVKAFQDEFERIWEEYNPANYKFFPKGSK